MPDFRRPHHRVIARILKSMNASFLERSRCYFGGGTLIAMALDEFRESRDIDFLCASRQGFRKLRETVSADSLGDVLRRPILLAREVRADRDGIRTFLSADEVRVKFEIVLEARIDLAGSIDRRLCVPVLDLEGIVAEKFLANTDRGLDDATKSRDLIDLAFLAARYGGSALEPGLGLAETAYGAAVRRYFTLGIEKFEKNPRYASECARALGIEDVATMRKGVKILKRLC